MACTRVFPQTPIRRSGRTIIAPAAQIVVATGAGNITTNIAEAADVPPPPPPSIPIGAILAFAGDKPPVGWMICDGQKLSRALISSALCGDRNGPWRPRLNNIQSSRLSRSVSSRSRIMHPDMTRKAALRRRDRRRWCASGRFRGDSTVGRDSKPQSYDHRSGTCS